MNSKPELKRVLGLTTAILLVISSMIGSGVFKKIAPMSTALGDSNLILLAWLLAGVISMFGVFTYSGLATLTEEGGGQFEYFRIIYGKLFSFLFGWSCFFVIQTASIASIAYVFAESVNNLVGFGNPTDGLKDFQIAGFIFPFANSGVKIFTILTVLVLTAINYRGVKEGGLLNDIFSSAKIAGIIILIVAGFLLQGKSTGYSSDISVELAKPEGVMLMSAMFTAMLAAFWAYDGWINISYIGGEVKNPRKNIPIAIVAGTAIVMLLYTLVNYTYTLALPVEAYATIDAEGNKIAGAEMAQSIMGNGGFILISVLIMVCTFGATNASLMSSPRIYHQMAKTKLFFKSFASVHSKFHTPHISLMFQAVWASVLVISGTFDQLTNMLVFASFIAYGSGAVGLIYMKMRGKKVPDLSNEILDKPAVIRQKITVKVFGYPYIPIVFILFCIGLIINTLITMPAESLTGLTFMVLGIPVYYYLRRRNSLE